MKILKFFGEWCGPCKTLSKTMKEAGVAHQEIDVDNNEELTNKYKVRSVPTVVVVDNEGNEIGRFLGPKTKEQLFQELDDIRKKYEQDQSQSSTLPTSGQTNV